jgi:hypothetical protein
LTNFNVLLDGADIGIDCRFLEQRSSSLSSVSSSSLSSLSSSSSTFTQIFASEVVTPSNYIELLFNQWTPFDHEQASLSMMVYPTSSTGVLYEQGDPDAGPGWRVKYDTSNGGGNVQMQSNDGGLNVTGLYDNSTLTLNAWNHIYIAPNYRIYINGVQYIQDNNFQDPTVNTEAVKIGLFNGSISQIKYFSQTLSPSQRNENYNFGNGLAYSALSTSLRNVTVGCFELADNLPANGREYQDQVRNMPEMDKSSSKSLTGQNLEIEYDPNYDDGESSSSSVVDNEVNAQLYSVSRFNTTDTTNRINKNTLNDQAQQNQAVTGVISVGGIYQRLYMYSDDTDLIYRLDPSDMSVIGNGGIVPQNPGVSVGGTFDSLYYASSF